LPTSHPSLSLTYIYLGGVENLQRSIEKIRILGTA
jgi:hypothetical protein